MSPREYRTAEDLEADGFPPPEIRRRFPWATEYVALDGQPCWPADQLIGPSEPNLPESE
ncbi:MAG TPA: hypothetical protein VIL46_18945 [Gemmataceae bacterium]